MNTQRNYITEFIGLDLLRFILSIMVVIRHYYHFYGPFGDGPFKDIGSIITEQPFYSLLSPVYNYGGYAVQVFWLISGLIFYAVYNQEITNKEITFERFSFLRFSRLYPLHFLMLIVVVVAQLAFFFKYHAYFVYQTNDLSHFFLQLFFMGGWLPTLEHSFNIPVWSVSVEILVYIVFYLITAAQLTKGNRLILVIGIIFLFNFYGSFPPFQICMLYFFCGCLLARLIQNGVSLKTLLFANILISIILVVFVKVLKLFVAEEILFPYGIFLFTLRLIPIASSLVLVFILAFNKMTSKKITSLFRNLGNMTYSVYLVHFPLQIIIFLVLSPSEYTFFNNPLILFSFLVISLIMGWFVFEYFERPIQKYLRIKHDLKRRSKHQAATVVSVIDIRDTAIKNAEIDA